MTFCDEHDGGCGASLTSTDYNCGYCTNCRKETNPMTQMRYHMDNGFVMVEHTERAVLEQIRKNDPRFRRRHIYELLQMRPSLIEVGVVYEVDSNPPQRADGPSDYQMRRRDIWQPA